MYEILNSLKEIFEDYTVAGESLEDVASVNLTMHPMHLVLSALPALVIMPETQVRKYTRANTLQQAAYNKTFNFIIGCVWSDIDPDTAFDGASGLADRVMAIIETDTDIHALGYQVHYTGDIKYGSYAFGPDQVFYPTVEIPLKIDKRNG